MNIRLHVILNIVFFLACQLFGGIIFYRIVIHFGNSYLLLIFIYSFLFTRVFFKNHETIMNS